MGKFESGYNVETVFDGSKLGIGKESHSHYHYVAIEIPHVFLQTLIYGVVVYAMMDFEWTAVGLTPNQAITAIVSDAFYSIWNLFAGFLITRPKIPVWWRWYYWGCPIAWSLYGLGASQFGDVVSIMQNGDTVKDFKANYKKTVIASKLTLEDALTLARAFSHFLALLGIAETHHRFLRHVMCNIYPNLVTTYLIS